MPIITAPPNTDYVPGGDSDFKVWVENNLNVYTGTALTEPDPIQYGTDVLAFSDAYEQATNPATRTSVTVQAKDDARAAAETMARQASMAMQQAYRVGSIDASKLTSAGVRVPKTTNAPIPTPVAGPDLVLRSATDNVLNLQIEQDSNQGYQKPYGSVGAEIVRGIWTGDNLVEPTTFAVEAMATRKQIYLDTSTVKGMKIQYKARWVTTRGNKSPFGPPLDVFAM